MEQLNENHAQHHDVSLCIYDTRTRLPSAPQPAVLVNVEPRLVELLTHANAQSGQRCALLFVGLQGEAHRYTGRVISRELTPDCRTLLRLELDASLDAVFMTSPIADGSAGLPPDAAPGDSRLTGR